MAKLRHIALSVPDIEAAAKFYIDTFGMQRVNLRLGPAPSAASPGACSAAISSSATRPSRG